MQVVDSPFAISDAGRLIHRVETYGGGGTDRLVEIDGVTIAIVSDHSGKVTERLQPRRLDNLVDHATRRPESKQCGGRALEHFHG